MRGDPRDGALMVAEAMTLPDIWLTLHQSAQVWARQAGQPDGPAAQARVTDSDRRLLRHLTEVDHRQWVGLCVASGLTTTGVIATAWAGGASLAEVAAQWGLLVLAQHQTIGLSARLFPGHLAPVFPSLSAALAWTRDNHALLALLIGAQPEMRLDLPPLQLAAAPPLVAAALRLRTGLA